MCLMPLIVSDDQPMESVFVMVYGQGSSFESVIITDEFCDTPELRVTRSML